MCWLYEAAVQKIPDLSADLLLRPQPPCGLPDRDSPRSQRYLMTDSSSQAHLMVSTAEHVAVLAQQLGHSLALSVAHAAITGCLVQFLDVWRDGPPAFGRALSGTLSSRLPATALHLLPGQNGSGPAWTLAVVVPTL